MIMTKRVTNTPMVSTRVICFTQESVYDKRI